tara:strand:+ start:130492 stop:131802 length:1311 start_codon:yes stop_codon:yes gene_type:complete
MLIDNQDKIVDAERRDFKEKSPTLIRLAEIMGTVSAIRYTESKVEEWMQPVPLELSSEYESLGARAQIVHQPKGVVGVVAPWNGPIILSCMPLAGIIGAGNRAMIKPSELAPHSAALLETMIKSSFDESEVAVIQGGIEVAQEFTGLPFDHLLYTGSSRVAKLVMAAAAENLVPVTLELGGKCPVIIGADANVMLAAERLAYGKLIHAGQVCVSPDYLFIHEAIAEDFVKSLTQAVVRQFPSVCDNTDYSPMLNSAHFARLQALVSDAERKGAEVVCINPRNQPIDPESSLKFPLHLLLNVSDDMNVMQEEIFGPILPIMTYGRLSEAIDYINSKPNPLSAYYFGSDLEERNSICGEVTTGSIVFDDVLCQIFHEQIPFGGIGNSGMGRYRGREGFTTFSNQVSVLLQTDKDEVLKGLRPPYTAELQAFIDQQISC